MIKVEGDEGNLHWVISAWCKDIIIAYKVKFMETEERDI